MSIEARFQLARGDFSLDVDLEIPGTGVTALFGESGAGKSTTLRCIAGLERAPGGFLKVGDEIWQDENSETFLPVHRRPIGYVFQESSLFSHLSVEKNLHYGMRRTPDRNRQIQPEEAIEWLRVSPLLNRPVRALSGGERQRVAIARALLTSPRLLLMDEPLASLDLKSRHEIMPCLEQLHRRLSIPVIYVSHATDEVARLADHMVLLEGGKVIASGALDRILTQLDLPLAQADTAISVAEATVRSRDEAFGLTLLEIGGKDFVLPRADLEPGSRIRVAIQARDVSIARTAATDSSILNVVPVVIDEISEHDRSRMLVRLQLNGITLLSRITRKSAANLDLKVGDSVFAQVKSVASLE